jgi:DNA polymerase-3 subunit alpha
MREWDESHVLSYEMDALGLYITGHPLARHKDRLRKLVSHLINELDAERDFDKDVRLAGIIGALKPLKTKKDERMATFFLEDLTGKIEVVAFPESFGKYGPYLREGQLVWIKGKYMGEEDNRRISLSQAMPLTEAFEKQAKRVVVRIFLPGLEEATLAELKTILDGYEGRCPVEFELETPHSYRLVAQSAEVQRVTPSEELIKKIEDLLGENSVSVDY